MAKTKTQAVPKKGKVKSKISKEKVVADILAECEPVKQNMGIGKIGQPENIFIRKFRWTLESVNLPPYFVKNVKFDFAKKQIQFEYYDIVSREGGLHAIAWAYKLQARQIPGEELVFFAFDATGNPLYRQVFKGLKLVEHKCDFDYSSSEVSTQDIVVSYEYMHTEFIACPSPIKNYDWKLRFENDKGEALTPDCDVILHDRPSLDIQETEVNFLNSKIFTPGKGQWKDVRITAGKEIKQYVGDHVMKTVTGEKTWQNRAVLTYYENGKAVERWTLLSIIVKKVDFNDNECEFVLYSSNVKYEQVKDAHNN